MYTQNLKKAHNYSELNKCISILFIDFELEKLKEIPKYLTKWNIREENYGKIILTEALEFYIIDLSKIKRYSENKLLDTWVKFISNSEDLNMENADESIKKAKEVLEEISEDEHEQYLAHLREKYIFQIQGIEEAGFDKGWPSRFDTWYKLPMEFGFLYYEMNAPIEISTTGHMLIDAHNENLVNDEKIKNVFLNSLMKYQTNNPFRKNANDNSPLVLLLQVIKLLKDDPDENDAGIFRSELSLIICWPNRDA